MIKGGFAVKFKKQFFLSSLASKVRWHIFDLQGLIRCYHLADSS